MTTQDAGANPVDASGLDASTPDAMAGDVGTLDAEIPDSSMPDAGPDAGQPVSPTAVVQLRELSLNVFGSNVLGNVLIARAPGTFPAAGCVRYSATESAPMLPSLGMLSAMDLDIPGLACSNTGPRDGNGISCLTTAAGPPPIAGSTLDTGPWLTAMDPTLGVTGGVALGAASAVISPPSMAADILEPQTLPAANPGDLTVRWTPLGSLAVTVEVELMIAGSSALVVCGAEEDGRLVVPGALLDGDLLRLTVGNFSEVEARDADDRAVSIQIMRGTVLSP